MNWNVLDLIWRYFAGFDSFHFGLLSALGLLMFLFAFSYAAYRGREENPMQLAAEVSIYVMVFALALDFMNVPSLIVGILIILAYELISKHLCKTRFRVWVEGFISLWILLTIFALVGEYLRPIIGVIGLVIFFAMSEVRVRELQKEKAGSEEKKK
ncbi:Uncharacterised protein [uncultured archaeon]|nr:Uncharacterised protein [uncultured archaeon]